MSDDARNDEAGATGKEALDRLEFWRCPQLGGPVTFKYCRVMNGGRTCSRVIACWGGTIDVGAFLEANFTPEELAESLGGSGSGRVGRMIEGIERARRETEEPRD